MAETVKSELDAIIARGRDGDPAFQAEVRLGIVRDPFEVSEDAPIVATLRRVAKAVSGNDRIFTSTLSWMDSALLQAADIPSAIFVRLATAPMPKRSGSISIRSINAGVFMWRRRGSFVDEGCRANRS
jgi:hypothetical protein